MAHEDLARAYQTKSSSDRAFGWVFTVVILVLACWPLIHRAPVRWWLVIPAALLAAVTIARPATLAPANRLWTRFGLFLGRIVGPVATGVLYYVGVAPIGVLIRLLGKDPLRLKAEADAKTYWIERIPPGPPPGSLTNQF